MFSRPRGCPADALVMRLKALWYVRDGRLMLAWWREPDTVPAS